MNHLALGQNPTARSSKVWLNWKVADGLEIVFKKRVEGRNRLNLKFCMSPGK